ncbi:hypothetical protein PGT21_017186 [Puccinia graminis f. sp. tritici]|uniref:Uncharacterized protein n=1 Tax=Puccinia graminis f. sp. tritici TaxID=56615 RepID=A0A5B0NYF1_PUCGR|nr:hypothetical protein PGT21_017186 [Puccinia graminis f. sp. tritici]KAA1115785.1 hypothetical protein PGTUg99_031760 [Puccinia graminis f. sp. tritici]
MKLKDFEGLDQLKQTLEEILNSSKIIQPSVSQITNSNNLTPSNQLQPSSSQIEQTPQTSKHRPQTSPYDLLWPHAQDLKNLDAEEYSTVLHQLSHLPEFLELMDMSNRCCFPEADLG